MKESVSLLILTTVVALVILLTACPHEAFGEGARTRILMIASEEQSAESRAAIQSLQAQLSDLGVDFLVEWTPAHAGDLRAQTRVSERLAKESRAAIVFWADLSIGDQIFLYVSEPGGGRILVRTVPFEEDRQEDRFEVIAVIVRSVVEAIAKGGEIGISIPEPPQPPGPSSPSTLKTPLKTEPSFARLELAAAYVLTLYDKPPLFIHGARMGVAVRIAEWARLLMAYRFQIPFEVQNDLVAMKLRHHPFELGFSGRFVWGALYLDLGATLVNDPLTWSVESKNGARITPLSDAFRWLVAASPFVELGWSPSTVYKFYLAVGMDIFFNESLSFVERANGEAMTVVDPLDVRPYLQAGAVFYIF